MVFNTQILSRTSLQILMTLVTSVVAVSGLYFPMPELQLVAPPRNKTVLLRVTARLDSGLEPEPNAVTYKLDGPSWLWLDHTTHELRLSGDQHEGDFSQATVTASDRYRLAIARMRINVTILRSAEVERLCDEDGAKLCFWPAVQYQVFENRNALQLGPLGPSYLSELCPQPNLSYHLSTAKGFLHLESPPGSLWSKRFLDRDGKQQRRSRLSGPEVLARVLCNVTSPRGVSTYNSTVSVRVLDENDNPPRPKEPIEIFLNNGGRVIKDTVEGRKELLFMDNDTDAVNIHEVSILKDEMDLWRVECSGMLHLDHGWDHSFTKCSLIANFTKQLNDNDTYRLVLQVNDTAMLPSDKPSHVNVTLLLNTGPPPPPPPRNLIDAMPRYRRQTSILRYAMILSRVVQPEQGPHLQGLAFRLAKEAGPFNITEKGGIVYVCSMEELQRAPEVIELEIEWEYYDGSEVDGSANVTVVVHNGTAPACLGMTGKREKQQKITRCSTRDTMQECVNTCGVGTGRDNTTLHGFRGNASDPTPSGGCAWRGPKTIPEEQTTRYSTCTPDLDTCPDNVCDPLEDEFPVLCPQDCVPLGWAIGLVEYNPNGRGIRKGHDVCSCDGKCSCQKPKPPGVKKTTAVPSVATTPDRGVSAQKADHRASCGGGCKLGVVVGSLLLIGGTGGFIFWRYRLSGKGRRDHKFMGSAASISGVPSDYVDRSLQPLDATLMTHDAATPLATPDPRTTPDPKWEFPRSRLVIEQTLGEGEFGRVLRARAMDIGGVPGYTTVAVKTLKEDASTPELADLLSEYQLLKEVSHPNVVRLLGACTVPGAPVYLIIEFAEHGSLRNYLRKSRHLESDGQIPCSFELGSNSSDPPPAPTPATPRDILSFAWQISKGMSYLSEIKLVHRDLAARNVLVGAGRVCKISDFGLTRDVYEDDAYLKRSKGRVPVKWMALESLADHMYTSKSDVWSFGVLMWELVTLGASPYPGVAVHNLFHLLRAGYRMEKPENCSSPLYRVMRSCWHEDPSERPSFKELTGIFERMLEDGVEYLDLNPRIVHNRTYFTSLSSSRDVLDDDDLGYGNLNILPTDSVNYLTPHQRQLQPSASRMPLLSTGDEEQRLLTTPATPSSPNMHKSSSQIDIEKQEESPRLGNAYLSPIRQPNSLNRISNDTAVLNPSSVSLTQSYINMTVGQPKRGSSQDLLVTTSPVNSKVTPF